MNNLIRLGYRVPEDVRIAGIDDVAYANLLPTPIGDSSPTVQRNWSRDRRGNAGTDGKPRYARSRFSVGL